MLFLFQDRFLLFAGGIVGKEIHLLRLYLPVCKLLRSYPVCHQAHTPHRKAGIYDAVKEGHGSVDDILGGGSGAGEMLRAVGRLRDTAAIGIRGAGTGVPIGASGAIIPHGEHQLPRHQPLIHQIQRQCVRHLPHHNAGL